MRAIYVIAAILLLLFLLSLVRVGAWVEYSESGLLAKLRIGPFFIQLFPVKPKKKKAPKKAGEKKKKQPAQPAEKPKRGGSLTLVKELLPVVADAAGQLKRRIRIDDLKLDLVWSAPDPAACAMGFGAANAAVGMIWPLVAQNFQVKDHRIRTAVDFEQGKPTVYLSAMATLTIGQGVSLGLRVGLRLVKAYLRAKKESNVSTNQQKEAV